jgi:hypothetical protein
MQLYINTRNITKHVREENGVFGGDIETAAFGGGGEFAMCPSIFISYPRASS